MKNYINPRLGLLALVLAIPLSAQTVISYDDGSTYTLEENERIFISKNRLFGLTQTEGVFSFGEKLPNDKRDYQEEESYEDYPMGSEKWCELYVPWSEGFTWNMQAYLRYCPQEGGET